jgi:pantoate--beta-alanine ligase
VCADAGVRLVFAPSGDQMYPREQLVTVDPGPMGQVLEGEFRPGFFNGVLTVVLKLFQLVRPEVAVFGEKDAQQLALVRRMVADLDLGITVSSVPTVRDDDGVATSSRNRFLIGAERSLARALPSALFAGLSAAATGPEAVLDAAQGVLDAAGPSLRVDYLALVDPLDFRPVAPGYVGRAVLAVAAHAGATRLIDNVLVDFSGEPDAARH